MSGIEKRDESSRIRKLIELDRSTLPPDGGPNYNRLIFASSPYLLQHADNPVDWYPWGEEAFERAAAEDKPVFLSIGYATCHWCHVLAHESFEDPAVAEAFNREFVCIKVDREERPDIDEHYMAVAQMMTGSGGWPLNIFMTPEKRPFHAATYLPRTPRMGMPGIIQLLDRVAQLWRKDRQKLEDGSAMVINDLQRNSRPLAGSLPDRELRMQVCRQLATMYDETWGGFGTAPKFPMPVYVSFLLRSWRRDGTTSVLSMVEHLLRMLRRGGIYDQFGYGIHRYAVDQQWLVPHFEKMLYDQALVSTAYLEAFQATGDPFYLQVAEEILAFVLEEMVGREGGICAGQDADSEGAEGTYYLWTPAEVAAVIGPAAGDIICRLFDITGQGNFEGRNIPHLPVPVEEFARREGVIPVLLEADLERWRQALLAVRRDRIRPFRDEKVLTAWNGLMIAALAQGYAVTGKSHLLAAAERAAAFVEEKLTTSEGRLLRSYHLGSGAVFAFLEDYSCFIWGLLELHQATLAASFLDRAIILAGEMIRLFGSDNGGLYDTGSDSELLPVRRQSVYDGVLPSGNSMAAFTLFRLGRISGETGWLKAGESIVRAFMGTVSRQPLASLHLLAAADYHEGPETIITLTGNGHSLDDMLRTVHLRYLPGLAIRHGGEGVEGAFPAVNGLPTAYVCARGACLPPVTDAAALGDLLDGLG